MHLWAPGKAAEHFCRPTSSLMSSVSSPSHQDKCTGCAPAADQSHVACNLPGFVSPLLTLRFALTVTHNELCFYWRLHSGGRGGFVRELLGPFIYRVGYLFLEDPDLYMQICGDCPQPFPEPLLKLSCGGLVDGRRSQVWVIWAIGAGGNNIQHCKHAPSPSELTY